MAPPRAQVLRNRPQPPAAGEESRGDGAEGCVDDLSHQDHDGSETNTAILAAASSQLDELLLWLQPCQAAERRRREVFERVRSVVLEGATGAEVFSCGSYPLKTYLPDGDIDMVVVFPGTSRRGPGSGGGNGGDGGGNGGGGNGGGEAVERGLSQVNTALCLAAMCLTPRTAPNTPEKGGYGVAAIAAGSPTAGSGSGAGPGGRGRGNVFSGGGDGGAASGYSNGAAGNGNGGGNSTAFEIRNVSFVNARTRIITTVVQNVSVDLTANQLGSCAAVALLEAANRAVGRGHLLKRALIALKAWGAHESPQYVGQPVLGGKSAGVTSYALAVMVLHVFHRHGGALCTVLDAVLAFFRTFAEFDWEHEALCWQGSIPLTRIVTPEGVTAGSGGNSKAAASGVSGGGTGGGGGGKAHRNGAGEGSLGANGANSEGENAGNAETASGGGGGGEKERKRDGGGGDTAGGVPGLAATVRRLRGLLEEKEMMFPVRHINIQDPLILSNNLGFSVSRAGAAALATALRLGRDHLEALLSPGGAAAGAALARVAALTAAAAAAAAAAAPRQGRPMWRERPREVGRASARRRAASRAGCPLRRRRTPGWESVTGPRRRGGKTRYLRRLSGSGGAAPASSTEPAVAAAAAMAPMSVV
ncbi:unnamed protein product, partial [Phaeothamnion confervicola]